MALWLKRFGVGALLIGVLYVFLVEPEPPSASGFPTGELEDMTLPFGVFLAAYIAIAIPIAYGIMNRDDPRARLVKDGIWGSWLVLTFMIVFAYVFIFHPSHMIYDGTDGPEVDTTTSSFWWETYFPYYLSILALALVIGGPAIFYWVRRIFPRA